MRCGRCGKHFDEEMYSGICPKCGHFNSKQTEYDVSKYFSAKFGDEVKTSTSAQAAKQHAELHKMYDQYNMHKPGAQQAGSGQHVHQAGNQGAYQQRSMQAKANPYQQAGTYQAGQTGKPGGAYPQRTVQGNTYQTGETGSYQQRQAQLNGETKERNFIPAICILIIVMTIVSTITACSLKKMRLTKIYTTLDYEQKYAEPGEIFEINNRLLIVDQAEIVDTSMLEGLPEEKMLVSVTVGILPAEEWERNWTEGAVYLSDGETCRQSLDDYVLNDMLSVKEEAEEEQYMSGGMFGQLYSILGAEDGEILTEYSYLNYDSVDGKTGKFYFLADKGAEDVTISFDQMGEKEGVSVLEKRVSVPLSMEGKHYEE